MKRKLVYSFIALLVVGFTAEKSFAELGGQVFYRFGYAKLSDNRGGEVFTDTLNGASAVTGVTASNDDDAGWAISAGLDVPLTKLGGATLLGEVMVEYARFSDKKVVQTTNALLVLDGAATLKTEEVTVSELQVAVAPKIRFEAMNGKVRPWIIPAGLAFLVNSPPSNDTTYLSIGYHVGAGVEYRVVDLLSVGVDGRYTFASNDADTETSYGTVSLYVGINF
ncbi:MAG TPA: hypothetical protein ENJ37_06380 [Deltaproteobacteria bacterium]|nr:hypothetical protein [Deltaproteobacteria bacterium]